MDVFLLLKELHQTLVGVALVVLAVVFCSLAIALFWTSTTKALARHSASVRLAMLLLGLVALVQAQKTGPRSQVFGRQTLALGTDASLTESAGEQQSQSGTADLCFSGIDFNDTSVCLSLRLAPTLRLRRNRFYVGVAADPSCELLGLIQEVVVPEMATNVEVVVEKSLYASTIPDDKAFFKAVGVLEDQTLGDDSDSDGIPDCEEEWYQTDPLNTDTDGDGLLDGVELALGTDPCGLDTDGDGVSDSDEVALGSDPLFPPVVPQSEAGPYYELIGANHYITTYVDSSNRSARRDFVTPMVTSEDEVVVPSISYYETWEDPYRRVGSGMGLRALRTGRLSFQLLEADDRAHVYINGMDLHGSYLGEKPEASTVVVAGETYPIRIETENDGGPAQLSFSRWAEFSPVERIGLRVGFSKNIVLFEDAYQNSPSELVPRQSTKTTLRVMAKGGEFGGRLSLRKIGMEHLQMKDAGCVAVDSVEIPPGASVCVINCPCEGVSPSSEIDDTRIEATFVENGTGATLVSTASVTVVRVEIFSALSAPDNASFNRHDYGLGESMFVLRTPASANVSIVANDASVNNEPNHHKVDWGVCDVGHSLRIECGETVYKPRVSVLAPTGILAKNPEAIDAGLPPGAAGGVKLRQTFVVLPLSVSFANLKIEEVPCTDAIPPEGYFARLPLGRVPLTHTREARAGVWCDVDLRNQMGTDEAAFGSEALRMKPNGDLTSDHSFDWQGGGVLTWKVPFGWKSARDYVTDAEPIGVFATDVRQIFRLRSNGTFRVEKLGHYAQRTLVGRMKCGDLDDGADDEL